MKVFPKKLCIRLAAIALLVVMLGLGCKGLSAEEQAAVRPVTLEYWTVFNDGAELRKLADQYQQVRPYVTINIRQIRPAEFDSLFVNALADDVGPDIVSVHTRWLAKYRNRLSAMPASVQVYDVKVEGKYAKETVVTERNMALPNINTINAQFVQTVGEDVEINGQVYGLPLALDTMALYYNKDLLDKAGVPEPPTTWDDFLAAVEASTKFDNNDQIIQSGVALGAGDNIEHSSDIFALLMMQNGIDVTKRGRVAFADGMQKPTNSHPTLQALRFYTDFARPTKKSYSWNEQKPDALEEFTRGKSVFYFGFAFDYPRIQARAPQMNVEVIPVPQLNPSAPSNIANYWVESVVKKSPHQNESWDFVRFMTRQEGIAQYTEGAQRPTPLRSQIKAQEGDLMLQPFVSQVLVAKNWYRGRDIDTADRALHNLIRDYKLPYSEKQKPLERDANLITHAARIIAQTM